MKPRSKELAGTHADKKKKMLEKDIQREICDYLDMKGYFFWRQNNIPIFGRSNDGSMRFRSMPKYTPKGLPDIFILNAGKLIGLEVKCTTKPRPDQIIFGEKMWKNGAMYQTVYSLDDVVRFIPQLKNNETPDNL